MTGALLAVTLTLGVPFRDGAVLQRGVQVPVWGRADAGASVSVSFAGQRVSCTAGADGKWRVGLAPLATESEGRQMQIVARAADGSAVTNVVKDVLVGEVWLAAGQSNMQFSIWNEHMQFRDAEQGALMTEITRLPKVRFFRPQNVWSVVPLEKDGNNGSCNTRWFPLVPKTFRDKGFRRQFSAVAFYFARELHQALGVPVGILETSWGGTPIDAWTPRSGYVGCEASVRPFADYAVRQDWQKERDAFGVIERIHHQPTVIWNGMVDFLKPYAVKGMIWYQGCNNSSEPAAYCAKMKALYKGWTTEFEHPGLPFYFVQLVPFTTSWFEMAAAQQKFADEEPEAAIAVASDMVDFQNIHPVRKEPVARRLLLHALKRDYGFDIPEDESPTFLRAETKGDELHVTFAHAKSLYEFGQKFSERPPFEICGTNGVWKTAVPVNLDGGKTVPLYDLKGDTLILKAEGILAPNRVRYMYQPRTRGCIYNEMSLPLGPFEGVAR